MAWVDDCETAADAWRRGVLERKARLRRLEPNIAKPLLAVIEQIPPRKRTVAGALVKPDFHIIWQYADQIRRINAAKRGRPTIERIVRETALQFRVDVEDILSHRRTKEVVLPRQVAMYLAKELTLWSFPHIGRKIGSRDHTTVLYAWRKIKVLRLTDVELNTNVDVLIEKLRGPV